MAVWQAFVLGAFVSLVITSIIYGSLILQSEEKAYMKGFSDGKKSA